MEERGWWIWLLKGRYCRMGDQSWFFVMIKRWCSFYISLSASLPMIAYAFSSTGLQPSTPLGRYVSWFQGLASISSNYKEFSWTYWFDDDLTCSSYRGGGYFWCYRWMRSVSKDDVLYIFAAETSRDAVLVLNCTVTLCVGLLYYQYVCTVSKVYSTTNFRSVYADLFVLTRFGWATPCR